jgi:GNAT superfamily N-acetyltransferase
MRRVVARALYRLARARVFRFFARGVTADAAPVGEARLEWLTPAVLAGLTGDRSLDLETRKIEAAFARGDVCAGACIDGRLAGYCWFATGALPHLDGVYVQFSPHVLWVYKSFVIPAFRGRGVAAALYGFGDDAARTRGCTASLICVEADNAPSVAAALRAGYRPAGHAAYSLAANSLSAWYGKALSPYAVRFFLPPGAHGA